MPRRIARAALETQSRALAEGTSQSGHPSRARPGRPITDPRIMAPRRPLDAASRNAGTLCTAGGVFTVRSATSGPRSVSRGCARGKPPVYRRARPRPPIVSSPWVARGRDLFASGREVLRARAGEGYWLCRSYLDVLLGIRGDVGCRI